MPPFSIEEIVQDRCEWLAANDEAELLEECEQGIANRSASVVGVAYSPIAISHVLFVQGAREIAEGVESGWRKIHLAWRMQANWLYVTAMRFDQANVRPEQTHITVPRFGRDDLVAAGLGVSYAFLVGEQKFAVWMRDRLLRSMNERDALVRPTSWMEGLVPFLLALHSTTSPDVVPPGDVPWNPPVALGVYQPVLDAWHDGPRLEAAIRDACDFHCDHDWTGETDEWNPFLSFPYPIVPVEILSIYAVRSRLGLDTPVVSHPLLDSPFAKLPTSPPETPSELLDRVVARCRKMFPKLEELWPRTTVRRGM